MVALHPSFLAILTLAVSSLVSAAPVSPRDDDAQWAVHARSATNQTKAKPKLHAVIGLPDLSKGGSSATKSAHTKKAKHVTGQHHRDERGKAKHEKGDGKHGKRTPRSSKPSVTYVEDDSLLSIHVGPQGFVYKAPARSAPKRMDYVRHPLISLPRRAPGHDRDSDNDTDSNGHRHVHHHVHDKRGDHVHIHDHDDGYYGYYDRRPEYYHGSDHDHIHVHEHKRRGNHVHDHDHDHDHDYVHVHVHEHKRRGNHVHDHDHDHDDRHSHDHMEVHEHMHIDVNEHKRDDHVHVHEHVHDNRRKNEHEHVHIHEHHRRQTDSNNSTSTTGNGVPGKLDLVSTDRKTYVASLVLSEANSTMDTMNSTNNSEYVLSASNTTHTQFWLSGSSGSSPGCSSADDDLQTNEIPITLSTMLFNRANATLVNYCAAYLRQSNSTEPMTVEPCDKTTELMHCFAYNTQTDVVRPFGRSTPSSATGAPSKRQADSHPMPSGNSVLLVFNPDAPDAQAQQQQESTATVTVTTTTVVSSSSTAMASMSASAMATSSAMPTSSAMDSNATPSPMDSNATTSPTLMSSESTQPTQMTMAPSK